MSQGPELAPLAVAALIRRERLAQASRLLRGVVHNLAGALQMLRLPLDLLELRLAQGQVEDLSARFGSLQNGFARVQAEVELLGARANQLQPAEAAEVDLARLAGEQLAFWRGDMYFKHEAQARTSLPALAEKAAAPYQDAALAFNVLVANALESLAQAGAHGLSVRYLQKDGLCLLEVADDGPGPSAEMAGRMFEPFTGDKGPEHDGLGLFLAQEALAPWGGRVHWRADPGPCFVLAIPQAKR